MQSASNEQSHDSSAMLQYDGYGGQASAMTEAAQAVRCTVWLQHPGCKAAAQSGHKPLQWAALGSEGQGCGRKSTGNEEPRDGRAVLHHDGDSGGVHAAAQVLPEGDAHGLRALQHRARGHQQRVPLHHD